MYHIGIKNETSFLVFSIEKNANQSDRLTVHANQTKNLAGLDLNIKKYRTEVPQNQNTPHRIHYALSKSLAV